MIKKEIKDSRKRATPPATPAIAEKRQRVELPKQPNRFDLKIFLKKKSRDYRLAVLLLGTALCLNLIALVFQFSGDFLADTEPARSSAFFWFLSVLFAGAAAWQFSSTAKRPKKITGEDAPTSPLRSALTALNGFIHALFTNATFLILAPILLFAFVIRMIPILTDGLFLDEVYWLETAKSILQGQTFSPFGFIGDQPSNLPAFPVALLLGITQNPVLAVRMTGVLYSLVAIACVFFLVRYLLKTPAAIVAAILMSISVWDIHMSIFGWNNVNLNPMLASAVLLLLFLAVSKNPSPRVLFFLAFTTAVCVHLLYVAALLSIPVFLVLAIHWLRNRSQATLEKCVLFSLFFFISISPLGPKLIEYPQSVSRHGEFLQESISQSEKSNSSIQYYADQFKLMGQDYTSGTNNFGIEVLWDITLDPMMQRLSLLGAILILIQTIRKKSDPFWLVILLVFCLQLLIPFVVLARSTSVWRSLILLPIAYLLTIYCIFEIARFFEYLIVEFVEKRKGLLNYFMLGVLGIYAITTIPWYSAFLSVYGKETTDYGTIICKRAADLIRQDVPIGSTVFIPDEMCRQISTVLFREDQYHIVLVRPEDPIPSATPGDYLILFNSQVFSPYKANIQFMLQSIVWEKNAQLVSPNAAASPVLYSIP
jgi:hypothetical protein